MPFVDKNTQRRRQLIYEGFQSNKDLFELNAFLDEHKEKNISCSEYEIWSTYLYPISSRDVIIRRAIIDEGKSLAWVAREFRRQSQRKCLS
jgi:hypothetical protein